MQQLVNCMEQLQQHRSPRGERLARNTYIYSDVDTLRQLYHCKKGKVVLTQFPLTCLHSLVPRPAWNEAIVCIVKHSRVLLPALDKNLIWLSQTSANVMGQYIVQLCGKGYEIDLLKLPTFSYSSYIYDVTSSPKYAKCLLVKPQQLYRPTSLLPIVSKLLEKAQL